MKKIKILLEVASKGAQRSLGNVSKGLKKVGTSSKVASRGMGLVSTGFKKIGLALKAAGIGLFITILSQMTGLWTSNQKASDTFSRIMIKLKPVFKAVGDVIAMVASVLEGLIDMFTSAIGWIGKLIGVTDGASSSASSFADALVDQRNKVKLLESELALLQLQYQREAELMRQIRDDEMLSIDDRIKANYELGKVLEEQLQVEKDAANEMLILAQMELSMDRDNIDLQKALLDAKVKLAEIDERITGQRSEQLVNLNSLERERDAQNKEAAAKRQEQLKKEQEMLDELLELQNEDLKQKKEINRTINEQLENTEEQSQKIIDELERRKQAELDALKTSKANAEENVIIQKEAIEEQEADLLEHSIMTGNQAQAVNQAVGSMANAMNRQLANLDTRYIDEETQKLIDELAGTQVRSMEDLEAYDKKLQTVLGNVSDVGTKLMQSNTVYAQGQGAILKRDVQEMATLFSTNYTKLTNISNDTNNQLSENAQGIIDVSQESLENSTAIIENYKTNEQEIIDKYDQKIKEQQQGAIDTKTLLQLQADEKIFLHFEEAKDKEIRLAKEKYADLLGDAENDAEATIKLKQEQTDVLAAIEQKYIDQEEKKKDGFYKFTETIETDARQKEIDDLQAHLDQILLIEGLTEEERMMAKEEFNRRKGEVDKKYDDEEIAKQKAQKKKITDMALSSMNSIVKLAGISAQKEIRILDKKFKDGEISEEEYNQQKNIIERKQAKKERKAALVQIGVDTARGIAGAVQAGAGLVFPANLAAIATGVAAVMGGVASAAAVLGEPLPEVEEVEEQDDTGDDETTDAGPVPTGPTFGAAGSAVAPVQAFVVETDISNAQALQSELDLQSTL
tara:strand:+ start:11004 stop:13568 length:2565 start_codon:yes stop_codon:yes gene_type:complete